MDLETIVKHIEDLESQLSSLKKSVASQNSRIGDLDDKAVNILEKSRETNNEVSKLRSAINGLNQFDPALTKLRVDIGRQLEEIEKRNQLNVKMLEKVHNDEVNSVNQTLEKTKRELSAQIDERFKRFSDENIRMATSFKETEKKVEEKINSDDSFKLNMHSLVSEFNQNKKVVDNLTAEFDVFKKRMEEVRFKSENLLDDIRNNESRLNEIVATENERKQTFIEIIEQQTLIRNERDRIWKDWENQFNDSINQVYKLIPDLQNQQVELRKTKESFEEITQKFERRINELTEMFRLMDEKFRKEWATFRSDLEKRWSGVTLLMEDKQQDFSGELDKINDRILLVEDSTHDMQEVLILMSKEIQKGMQGLMNMVNGWMDAFGQIK
jgi:chromosome segregation ATPase